MSSGLLVEPATLAHAAGASRLRTPARSYLSAGWHLGDGVVLVSATLAHARAIELRPGDAREIAALGETQESAFTKALQRSIWADAYLADGEVAALMGVILPSLLGGSPPLVWMLTGRPVDRHRKAFLRLTRTRVRALLAEHGTLQASVHAEYAGAMRWLRWLGFDLAPARPLGPLGAAFHEATLRTP